MKVTLGILLANGFPVPAPFVIGYSHLMQMLLTGQGNHLCPEGQITDARALFVQDFPIDWARNRCCQLFLDEDANSDYLLFLDADMRHPPLLPHRLVSHGKDVVTARYVTRRPPFFTVAMRKVGPGALEYQAVEKLTEVKGLLPIDAGGAGALLISREALERIRARFGDDWFRYQDGTDGLRSRSEDMWFYERCLDVGIQPYLDADTVCTHVSSFEVDPSWQRQDLTAEVVALAKAKAERQATEQLA